jgi:peptide/nickel transport system substrate-binding protein
MRKKPVPQLLMFVVSLGAALVMLLSACGAPGPSSASSSSSSATPVKGGTWIDDLYEEPDSLLPNASSETFSNMVDQALYTPLFVGDPNNVIHPALAAEIPTVANGGISKDLKTWTFHIRPGVTWSDGQPEDARDVDYSWKLWTNPKFAAASTVGFDLITSADVSADNMSITFHLSQPYAPFLSIWVDGINAPLPAHHFSGMSPDAITKSPDNLNPSVVSGPFMMKESKPGDHYTLVRNPKYYQAAQGLPYLDSVVFRVVPNQDTILKDLEAGTIDSAWFLDVSKAPAYQRLSDYTLSYAHKTGNFEAMYFNLNNKVLANNSEVRQAMAMAVDREALVDTARRGYATPLCTDHGPSVQPGYQPDAACPRFDLNAANALLDQHGWVKGSDGVRSKNGQRLEFQYSTTAGNLWREDDELINQQNFAKIGVKVDIENYPASTFFGPFLHDGIPGKYDLAEFEFTTPHDPDDAFLLACNQVPPQGENFSFYCNHQLDQLLIQEQQTIDPTARQQIFDQIHQIELTDFPFVVMYAPFDLAMVKKGTHNYSPSSAGASETINIWQWWCDNGKCPA